VQIEETLAMDRYDALQIALTILLVQMLDKIAHLWGIELVVVFFVTAPPITWLCFQPTVPMTPDERAPYE